MKSLPHLAATALLLLVVANDAQAQAVGCGQPDPSRGYVLAGLEGTSFGRAWQGACETAARFHSQLLAQDYAGAETTLGQVSEASRALGASAVTEVEKLGAERFTAVLAEAQSAWLASRPVESRDSVTGDPAEGSPTPGPGSNPLIPTFMTVATAYQIRQNTKSP